MSDNFNVSAAVAELESYGLKLLFEDAELRQACVDCCKQWVPTPLAKIGVETAFGVAAFCKEGVGANTARWLVRHAERTPVVRRLLQRMLAVCKGLSDKHRLREELIRNLRGDKTPITVPADSTTDLEIVKFLYQIQQHDEQHDELLATLDADLAAPLRALSEDIRHFLDSFYEPRLDDPVAKGRARRDRDRGVASLIADVAADVFREGEADLDFLDRFLGDLSGAGPRHRFSWALLTGPGGQGKTRLAIEFLARAKKTTDSVTRDSCR